MGEDIRELRWDPVSDDAPEDILEVVAYAKSKGIGLLAYVYPCLAFQAVEKYLIGNTLNIASDEARSWLLQTLSAFVRKTGAAGFAWGICHHYIFAGP